MAEPSAESITRPKRPFGVAMIALIQAVAAPTAGISLFLSDTPLGIGTSYEKLSEYVASIFGLIGLVIAVGLWRLKRWAWVSTMLWFGSSMAGALIAWRRGEPHYWLMVFGIVTVLYLNQRDVSHAFGAGRRRAPSPPPPPAHREEAYGHA